MARIFTISFPHAGQERSAVITVRSADYSTEYHVSLIDQEIMHELHSNVIVPVTGNRLRYQDTFTETEVMSKILIAVAEHISASALSSA